MTNFDAHRESGDPRRRYPRAVRFAHRRDRVDAPLLRQRRMGRPRSGSRRPLKTRRKFAAVCSPRSRRPSENPTRLSKARLLTFVVVGGGPTGVEMAGAISELARHTLRADFRTFNPATARVVLVEGQNRVLQRFDEKLSAKAKTRAGRNGNRGAARLPRRGGRSGPRFR